MPTLYSATVTYRPKGDETPESRCPTVMLRCHPTEEEMERDLAALCESYENQPSGESYEILRVERTTQCGKCSGSGELRINPKGWRKREPAPWYLRRVIPCPDCSATPAV